MRFLPVNTDALLVELDSLEQTLALFDALQARPIPGVTELVPAARTVLIVFHPDIVSARALRAEVATRDITATVARNGKLIEIPVHYNGEDLQDVARMLGLPPEEIVRLHTSRIYTVAFTGFAPGFAYLSGGDPRLDVPRRQTPRTRIPAGAVALAGTFSGIYPQASPGGWQILGMTDTPMWDISRETPALLQPGYRVRFIDAGPAPVRKYSASSVLPRSVTRPATLPALEIVAPGLQSLFQDLGRPEQARQGVAMSGAVDRGALLAANRLVGNLLGDACIETVYGGLQVRAHGACVVAVTGAKGELTLRTPDATSWAVPSHQAIALNNGDTLTLGQPHAGVRYYLAVRGGLDVAPVLGSRATDTLARIGPDPLSAGDRIAILAPRQGAIVGMPEAPASDLPRSDTEVILDIVLGPRTDWCDKRAVTLLHEQAWTVTPESNRVGIRLNGAHVLQRTNHAELASEGTRRGSIQVPPSGQPVVFLTDHPLTGGYPVIGSVAPWHLDLLGQVPIGARVRFNPISEFVPIEMPVMQISSQLPEPVSLS